MKRFSLSSLIKHCGEKIQYWFLSVNNDYERGSDKRAVHILLEGHKEGTLLQSVNAISVSGILTPIHFVEIHEKKTG